MKRLIFYILICSISTNLFSQNYSKGDSLRGNLSSFRSCYDEGKRCAETLFMDYKREHNLNIKIVRKSIVANQNIKKGDLLTDKNIAVKRPGGGISPMQWDKIIGTTSSKDYNADELI